MQSPFLRFGQEIRLKKFSENYYLGGKDESTYPVDDRKDALVFKVVPASGQTRDGELVTKDDHVHFLTAQKKFIERIYMIEDDRKTIHKAACFKVGLSKKPTQTALFISEHDNYIPIREKIGISFGGKGVNPLSPDYYKRTNVTFREDPMTMPQTLVSWWFGDEILELVR